MEIDFKTMMLEVMAIVCSYLILFLPISSAFQLNIYDNGNYQTTPLKITITPRDYIDIAIEIEPISNGLDNSIKIDITKKQTSETIVVSNIHFYRCLSRNVTACLVDVTPDSITGESMNAEFDWSKQGDHPNLQYFRTENFLTLVELNIDGTDTVMGFWDELYRETTSSIYHYTYELDSLDLYVKDGYSADDFSSYVEEHKLVPMTYIDRAVFKTFKDSNSADSSSYSTQNIYKASAREVPADFKIEDNLDYISGNELSNELIDNKYVLAFSEGENTNSRWYEIASPVLFEQFSVIGECGNNDADPDETADTCCYDVGCSSGEYCDYEEGQPPGECESIENIKVYTDDVFANSKTISKLNDVWQSGIVYMPTHEGGKDHFAKEYNIPFKIKINNKPLGFLSLSYECDTKKWIDDDSKITCSVTCQQPVGDYMDCMFNLPPLIDFLEPAQRESFYKSFTGSYSLDEIQIFGEMEYNDGPYPETGKTGYTDTFPEITFYAEQPCGDGVCDMGIGEGKTCCVDCYDDLGYTDKHVFCRDLNGGNENYYCSDEGTCKILGGCGNGVCEGPESNPESDNFCCNDCEADDFCTTLMGNGAYCATGGQDMGQCVTSTCNDGIAEEPERFGSSDNLLVPDIENDCCLDTDDCREEKGYYCPPYTGSDVIGGAWPCNITSCDDGVYIESLERPRGKAECCLDFPDDVECPRNMICITQENMLPDGSNINDKGQCLDWVSGDGKCSIDAGESIENSCSDCDGSDACPAGEYCSTTTNKCEEQGCGEGLGYGKNLDFELMCEEEASEDIGGDRFCCIDCGCPEGQYCSIDGECVQSGVLEIKLINSERPIKSSNKGHLTCIEDEEFNDCEFNNNALVNIEIKNAPYGFGTLNSRAKAEWNAEFSTAIKNYGDEAVIIQSVKQIDKKPGKFEVIINPGYIGLDDNKPGYFKITADITYTDKNGQHVITATSEGETISFGFDKLPDPNLDDRAKQHGSKFGNVIESIIETVLYIVTIVEMIMVFMEIQGLFTGGANIEAIAKMELIRNGLLKAVDGLNDVKTLTAIIDGDVTGLETADLLHDVLKDIKGPTTECSKDKPCKKSGETCDLTKGKCVAEIGGSDVECKTNEDCDKNELCFNGECFFDEFIGKSNCKTSENCPEGYDCILGTCIPSPAPDVPPPFYQPPEPECTFSECMLLGLVCDDMITGKCVECFNDIHCSVGEECKGNICTPTEG